MALVTRNNRIYRYKCKRINGKVKKIYDGKADFAVWAEMLDEDDRQARDEERKEQAELVQRERLACETERARGKAVASLVRLGLESQGFRQYNRSSWKRRQMSRLPATIPHKTDKKALAAETRRLVKAVVWDGQSAVPRLQAIARDHPDVFADEVEINPRGGCPSYAGGSRVQERRQDASRLHGARLILVTADLAGPNPSIARRLCAEQAAFCWAEVWILNCVAAGNGITNQSDQFARRMTAANRRLMLAMKMISQIALIESKQPKDVFDWQAAFALPVR